MPVVQEDDVISGLIWVRCPKCEEVKPIETNGHKTQQKSKAAKEAGEPGQGGKRKVIRHYRAGEIFSAGEWIYHPEWDDTGQVKEKFRSKGGREVIVVCFEKMGEKKLVTCYAG